MARKVLDGLPFPHFFNEENFHMIRNLELRRNDLLMTTFPKCGTHWTMYVIYSILHPEDPPLLDSKSLHGYCRFLDEQGLDQSKEISEDEFRMINTHLPINYMKKNTSGKIVGVIRNPFDCCVSMYKFFEHMSGWTAEASSLFQWSKDENGKVPDDFFKDFIQGDVVYGDLFKYVKALYERKDDPNVHMLIFEKMKANPKEETLKLARFLGHAEKLEADNGRLLNKIVEQTSFDVMKKVTFIHPLYKEKMKIMRTGEAGGYKEVLTPEQIKVLKDMMETELAGTELLQLWKNV